MSGGYNFVKNQWIMRKYTTTTVANCVTKGYITQEEADIILAMPQVEI